MLGEIMVNNDVIYVQAKKRWAFPLSVKGLLSTIQLRNLKLINDISMSRNDHHMFKNKSKDKIFARFNN